MAILKGNSIARELCDSDDALDIGDLVLFGMGETIQILRVLSGTIKPVVDLGDGVKVTIEEQDVRQMWRTRLKDILGLVCDVAREHPCLERDEICRALLVADGWSWTRCTFRTPLWIHDYDEVLLSVVTQEFEVLGWIVRSASEIK